MVKVTNGDGDEWAATDKLPLFTHIDGLRMRESIKVQLASASRCDDWDSNYLGSRGSILIGGFNFESGWMGLLILDSIRWCLGRVDLELGCTISGLESTKMLVWAWFQPAFCFC
ncbi:hypothetical protein PHJA_000312800 [Phtheirospermum japonicum]|uniref:Uncharacterized protein n=1 Tax=Phtheirospermum japonicum TaxID=374723 RepID=A0A830BCG4_9LAMI|nr:hypothetical protein PHJA_000312800 [Phtheirospermum japonicum]